MLTQFTDQMLIQAFKEGDDRAGEEIYQRYFDRTVHFCLQYLHVSEDALDAAQDVFVKVIVQKKIFTYRGESQVWAWLKRIALNVCHEYFRKRKPIQDLHSVQCEEFEYIEDVLPANNPNPEEQLEKVETSNQIHEAMNSLPEKYRLALTTRYLEENSYEETAMKLKLTSAVIGIHLLRGRRLLGKLFQKRYSSWAFAAQI